MKNNKKWLLALVAIFALVFITACAENGNDNDNDNGNDGGAGEVSDRSDLVIGLDQDIPNMDLHGNNTLVAAQVFNHVFETLIFQDAEMQLLPGLATEWELLEDGRTWEFVLREGVYFHNGQPFTAADVEFSMRRAADSPHMAPFLGMIDPDTIYVVDDFTIQIGTEEAFAPFLSHLAHGSAGIVNAYEFIGHNADEDGVEYDWEFVQSNLNTTPIGTGPFQFVSFTPSVDAVIERFDGYHATGSINASTLETITFRIITDGSARAIELESGGIDIDWNPQADDFQRLTDNPIFNLNQREGLQTRYIGMNTTRPHVDNYLVRQAINYAVNIEEILATVLNNNGVVARTPISSMVFGHDASIETFPFNPERASELLAEAGYNIDLDDDETFIDLNLYLGSDTIEDLAIVQAIAYRLSHVGINAEIFPLEWPTFLDHIFEEGNTADLFLLGWTTPTADADYGLFPLFHSTNHGASGNNARLTDAEVDRLLEAARNTIVESERIAYYAEVQARLRELAPWILLTNPYANLATRADVRGFVLAPDRLHFFGNVYFVD